MRFFMRYKHSKKLKRETIQGKLLAGSDPEVSSKLLEHGKQIEEHHKPLKQRTREHHVKPSGDSPQVGLKQLKEQERRATNDPKDSHFGGGMQSTRNIQYESGYGSMSGMNEEQKKMFSYVDVDLEIKNKEKFENLIKKYL